MSDVFLVLPNHLFKDVTNLKKYNKVYLLEEAEYFRETCNKVRLAYMRASMKYYQDYLKKKGISHVIYITTFNELLGKKIECYDPCDFVLKNKYASIGLDINYIEDSPLFIANHQILEEFHKKNNSKNISNASFYEFMKNKIGILKGVKNYDKENRKSLPESLIIKDQVYKSDYYSEAINYIDNHPKFKDNIGETKNVKYYPCTHASAEKHLLNFLKNKLHHFGDYQDAIDKDHVFLYHASISCAMNNGLLAADYVVKFSQKYYESVSINNYEGFIRQLMGWREYMHYIYIFHYTDIIKANHWESHKRIKDWDLWYKGETGIDTLDNEIRKCVKYAYSHHIVRLMIFLNIFVLCRVCPEDIVKWFMDVCAIDAYPWVMWSNIIAMGWFSPRFMKKPYISTENYIVNMSNYKKKPCPIWKALFYNFLNDNKSRLIGTSRIYLRNLSTAEKGTSLDSYKSTSNLFMKRVKII
jgi:deoxyribodipyrimidine photolyase-related protein